MVIRMSLITGIREDLIAGAGVLGSNGLGNVGASGAETELIGNPGKSHALAFGRDPVNGSLVGVATVGVVVTVSFGLAIAGVLALDVGLLAGGTIGSLEAVILNR